MKPEECNILLIDTVHPVFTESLISSGFQVTDGTKMSETEILETIHRYEGIQIRSRIKIGKEFLDRATGLRFIARAGAGMESIDEAYAQQKNIACLSAPEGNRDAVAEHVLSMLLCLFNNINRADKEVREHHWNREANRGMELMGKTVGIIGYGNMGSATARRMSGFDCEVLAYDKYKPHSSDPYAKRVSLEELQAKADIISLHLPLTDETKFMVNREFLDACKKPVFLVNTARGKIVKTADLVEGMKSGKARGACLDVLEYESHSFENFAKNEIPEPYEYLLQSDRVVLTPHIAGWTKESLVKIATTLVQKIRKLYGIE